MDQGFSKNRAVRGNAHLNLSKRSEINDLNRKVREEGREAIHTEPLPLSAVSHQLKALDAA
jgi:hypothetical protein